MTLPPTDVPRGEPLAPTVSDTDGDALMASLVSSGTTTPLAPTRVVPRPRRSRLAALGPAFLVLAVALAASATSLGNGFAFDDRWIIQFNLRLHDLGRVGKVFTESYWPVLSNGLYRPLVSLGYALQWAVGGGSPGPFHVVNVALYAGATLAVWRLATRVLPAWAALLAGVLFAAHPVHVEATANVVGQAELACTLLLAAATSLYIGWRADLSLGRASGTPGWGRIGALGLMYGAATLYKEQGIVLPALLAAAELTVVADRRPLRERAAALRPLLLALVLVAVLLLVARWLVLGALGGDVPIAILNGLSMPQRTLAMLGLVPELARLLLWPAGLSADYGPRHVTFAPAWTLASVAGLLIVAGTLVAAARLRRVQPAVAFGVAWLCITYAPVSNVALPSGILLAERTLFAPSAGVVLAVAGLLAWLATREPLEPGTARIGIGMLVLVVFAGTTYSALRQPVWKDNATLFAQMVEDAPMSARAHYALGGHYFEVGRLKDGEEEWRVAIVLDSTAWRIRIDLADRYRGAGFCEPAIPHYRIALAAAPDAERARLGLVVCLRRTGRRDEARQLAMDALKVDVSPRPGLRMLRHVRATSDSAADAALGIKPVKPATPPTPPAAATSTPAVVTPVTPPRTSGAPRVQQGAPARAGTMTHGHRDLPQVARHRAGRMAPAADARRDARA